MQWWFLIPTGIPSSYMFWFKYLRILKCQLPPYFWRSQVWLHKGNKHGDTKTSLHLSLSTSLWPLTIHTPLHQVCTSIKTWILFRYCNSIASLICARYYSTHNYSFWLHIKPKKITQNRSNEAPIKSNFPVTDIYPIPCLPGDANIP